MLSKRRSSSRVAPAEWIAKLIPSSWTVAPKGSGVPGNIFLIFGMVSQADGTATDEFVRNESASFVPPPNTAGRTLDHSKLYTMTGPQPGSGAVDHRSVSPAAG